MASSQISVVKPGQVIDWLQTLKVTEGPLEGENFRVLPFQRRFVAGMLSHTRAGLSIARGNGKTTLAAAIGACSFLGTLAVRRAQTVIVASSLGQARLAFNHTRWFLRPALDHDRRRFREIENSHECRLEDRVSGSMLRALGSDPKRAHGLAPKLAICDEPAQWPANHGPKMYAALKTALGKHRQSKLIGIGTRPEDKRHWFSLLLNGGRSSYSQVHAAPDKCDEFSMASIRAANPAWDYMPDLRKVVLEERDDARHGGLDYTMYKALRLNMGTPDSELSEVLVTQEDWAGCVVRSLPPREGPCFVSFDLGGSSSMTAFAAYWPQSGRLETSGAFPGTPSLDQRGLRDIVGDRYVAMQARGEIRTYPGLVTPVSRFLGDCGERLNGVDVEYGVADRYRKTEAEQAINTADLNWEMQFRAVGAGVDGSEDIRAFQAEVLEAQVKTLPSLLLESGLSETIVARDTNGNPRIDKARDRGRIDVVTAAVQAVAAGRRWRYPPELEQDSDVSDYILSELYETG